MATGISVVGDVLTQHSLRCVLIGGHAIGARGFTRATFDIDLVIDAAERDAWRAALTNRGYSVFHEHGAFLQLSAPSRDAWPIDIMLVEAKTFAGLYAAADAMAFGDSTIMVASRAHLIAMKLHALKAREEQRRNKDSLDLAELLRLEGVALDSATFEQLCLRYGDPALLVELRRRLGTA